MLEAIVEIIDYPKLFFLQDKWEKQEYYHLQSLRDKLGYLYLSY